MSADATYDPRARAHDSLESAWASAHAAQERGEIGDDYLRLMLALDSVVSAVIYAGDSVRELRDQIREQTRGRP